MAQRASGGPETPEIGPRSPPWGPRYRRAHVAGIASRGRVCVMVGDEHSRHPFRHARVSHADSPPSRVPVLALGRHT